MKKTAIALAVALAGFAATTQAAPQDDSWYVGGKVGWSHYDKTGINQNTINGSLGNKSQIGAGAFAGYQHNQYLGFEVGYDWLGRMNKLSNNDPSTARYTAQGVQVTTKLSYPVADSFDVYTRLGGMVWRGESKGTPATGTAYNETDYGISPLAAAGVEFAVSESWATRLDYQYTWHVGDNDSLKVRPNNGFLSLGVSYRYGNSGPAIAAVPAPVAPMAAAQPEPKKFTLTSDVLFNFGKHDLKEQGRHALDQLYGQLSAIDPKEGSVVVIGHTDRIGSEQANQRLSDERAHSVVQYLVHKGIPAERISAKGVGKTSPVTGSSCDSTKHRAKLIECLAPDRRVEIEVTGLKEVAAE